MYHVTGCHRLEPRAPPGLLFHSTRFSSVFHFILTSSDISSLRPASSRIPHVRPTKQRHLAKLEIAIDHPRDDAWAENADTTLYLPGCGPQQRGFSINGFNSRYDYCTGPVSLGLAEHRTSYRCDPKHRQQSTASLGSFQPVPLVLSTHSVAITAIRSRRLSISPTFFSGFGILE